MKNDDQKLAGCGLALLSLIILCPMSIALWFGVLLTIEAPTWMWVLFWVYVPALVVLTTIRVFVEEILKD